MNESESIYASSYNSLSNTKKREWTLAEYVKFCEEWDSVCEEIKRRDLIEQKR